MTPENGCEGADDLRQRCAQGDPSCVFCAIIAGNAPATIIRSWPNAIAIKPLNPVTEGHTLIIPAAHVRDVAEDPEVSALTMAAAAEYAAGVGPCNVITSAGREATQTVFHLHAHVVPRRAGDGLSLPWTGQERAEKAERRAANAEERLSLARDALLDDGYFKPDEVGADVAPRITERLSALRHELEQWHAAYGETALPGALARLRTAEATVSRVRELADVYELNAGTVDGVAARNFFELFAAELRDALNPPAALLAEEETGPHGQP